MLQLWLALWLTTAAQQSGVTALKDYGSIIVSGLLVIGAVLAWGKSLGKWNGLEADYKAAIAQLKHDSTDAVTRLREDVAKSLNGMGERVSRVETAVVGLDTRADTIERVNDRAADDRARLHERMGQAEKSADHCETNMTDIQVNIVGKITDMQRQFDSEMSKMRERLVGLEKEVDIRLRGNGNRERGRDG